MDSVEIWHSNIGGIGKLAKANQTKFLKVIDLAVKSSVVGPHSDTLQLGSTSRAHEFWQILRVGHRANVGSHALQWPAPIHRVA